MKHALSSAYDPVNLTWRFKKNFARLKIEIRDRGQMTSWHMLLCNFDLDLFFLIFARGKIEIRDREQMTQITIWENAYGLSDIRFKLGHLGHEYEYLRMKDV